MTPDQVRQLLAELATHESDCSATPDRDSDPHEWEEAPQLRAAAAAYRHAQQIVRRIARIEVAA